MKKYSYMCIFHTLFKIKLVFKWNKYTIKYSFILISVSYAINTSSHIKCNNCSLSLFMSNYHTILFVLVLKIYEETAFANQTRQIQNSFALSHTHKGRNSADFKIYSSSYCQTREHFFVFWKQSIGVITPVRATLRFVYTRHKSNKCIVNMKLHSLTAS